ncbi:SIMPL domain-containing protein [Parvibaculum sp.]|uniref:SIMPL domain-containing protein n=1 Tax=Parvibaculum sp. TaxID=2024848 RepID=UPI00391A8873
MPLSRSARPLSILSLSALAVAASLALAPAAHATEKAPRIITITGEGEVTAAPDIAYVDMGVVSEGKTAGEALAANTAAMEKVFEGLGKAGIDKKDMQTSNFSVYPVYEQVRPDDNRPHTPKIGGYTVQNQLTVKVRDLDNLGAILDRVVSLGSNQLSGVRFAIDDPKPLMNEARQAAVKDALDKAKLYAGAAGVAVGEILSISESGASMPQPYYAKDMMMAVRAEGAPVPMAAGEQTVSANVTLVIRIN